MSFSRIKPAGWAVNEKLTSAQQNALDIDHANAVDKYGDDYLGDMLLNGGARILIDSGAFLANLSGGIYQAQSGSNTNFEAGSFVTVKPSATWTNQGTMTSSGAVTLTGGSFTINSGVSTNIAASVSFNGTTFFSQPLTCYNNLVMSGNGVAGGVKLRVTSSAYLDMESLSRQRFFSGTTLEMQSGSTGSFSGSHSWFSGASCSWALGSTCSYFGASTHQNGATLTHANGSTETYASGSILAQSNGSSWSMGGGQTLISGGTWIANAGSVITINTSPTFGAGFTVSSGTTQINGTAINLSAVTTTLTGAGNKLKLTPRSVTRTYNPSAAVSTSTISLSPTTGVPALPSAAGSGQSLILPFTPPNGAIMTNITITWGSPGAPSVTCTVYRGNVEIVTPNNSSSFGTKSFSLTELCNTTTEHYRMVVTRISGASDITLVSATATYTVSEYADGCFLELWKV